MPALRFTVTGQNSRDRKANCASCHETEDAENGGDHKFGPATRPQRVNRKHKSGVGKVSSNNKGVRATTGCGQVVQKPKPASFGCGTQRLEAANWGAASLGSGAIMPGSGNYDRPRLAHIPVPASTPK